MIVKTYMVILILSITTSRSVSGGPSYSKVFLERDVVPVEYYQYGPPQVSNAQFSQLNSAPVQLSPPSISGLVPPCGTPCTVPSQPIASLDPSANVLTYNSPISSVPVVITPIQDSKPTGYEYSYVVYDENTGDHKAQRELSDGSVVRGEYSFLQPDGYVREVHYVADDVKGFNAIVRKFLPVSLEDKTKVDAVEKKDSELPCHDVVGGVVKSESIKEAPKEEAPKENPVDTLNEKLVEVKVQPEENHKQESSENIKDSGENSKELSKESNEIQSSETIQSEEPKESKEMIEEKPGEGSEVKSKDKQEENNQTESEKSEEVKSSEESSEQKSEENPKENHDNETKEESKEVAQKSKEKPNDEVADVSHSKYSTPPSQEVAVPEHDTLVSYNDIIRCVQAAINKAKETPGALRVEPSPLTYIILNKPCSD